SHPAPFGFRYFDIGNEAYFPSDADHHPAKQDPATYVTFARDFAALVAAIDPNAKTGLDVGGTSMADPAGGVWATNVLAQAAALGFTPGFLSDHSYTTDGGGDVENDDTLLRHTVSDPAAPDDFDGPLDWAVRGQRYEALINASGLPNPGAVELLATEY